MPNILMKKNHVVLLQSTEFNQLLIFFKWTSVYKDKRFFFLNPLRQQN